MRREHRVVCIYQCGHCMQELVGRNRFANRRWMNMRRWIHTWVTCPGFWFPSLDDV